jgi:uncharacterized protein (DUF1778 family)
LAVRDEREVTVMFYVDEWTKVKEAASEVNLSPAQFVVGASLRRAGEVLGSHAQ